MSLFASPPSPRTSPLRLGRVLGYCAASLVGFTLLSVMEEPLASAAVPGAESEPAQTSKQSDPEYPRERFGVSGLIGTSVNRFGGGEGSGALAGRFGVQTSRKVAYYFQPMLLLGQNGEVTGEGADYGWFASIGGLLAGAAAFEYTAADRWLFAVGPEIGVFGQGKVSSGVFGLTTRVAFAIGVVGPERRSAFSLSLETHLLEVPALDYGPLFIPMFGLGYEAY